MLVRGPDARVTVLFVADDPGQLAPPPHRHVEDRADPLRLEVGVGELPDPWVGPRVVCRDHLVLEHRPEVVRELRGPELVSALVGVRLTLVEQPAPKPRVVGCEVPEADPIHDQQLGIDLEDLA